ncbi:MAG: phosphoribosylamine--glycine ligase [Bacillota bacterium]|jgi:phosphoribosylamine--glycine ligase|nr:phosphoribosylamine--glycine ligase [Bacillota bacterium]NLH88098.1 phosphoribosylamine--glycine ligase [Bacillota bacterium]
MATRSPRPRILVVGSGGREHAIVWKLAASDRVGEMYAAPGNAGIAQLARCVPIDAADIDGLARFAREASCDMVIVGPELPLSLGLADRLASQGHAVFGPTAAAARIESSKAYAKGVMERAGIPTASYEVFDDPFRARQAAVAVASRAGSVVVKLDALAAGKGVVVAHGPEEAGAAVDSLAKGAAGNDGFRLIIEECLEGYEASIIGISDGKDVVTLVPAKDHKRAFDGDIGPNTGGMGAIAPAPGIDRDMLEWISDRVLLAAVRQMAQEGVPFAGALFAGLMITDDGPKVLEFNCRFGDPETQAIMPLLGIDLLDLVEASCHGCIGQMKADFRKANSTCVVMASKGYPGHYGTGAPIRIPTDLPEETVIFHAGTRIADGRLVSAGGRVLGVTAVGSSTSESRRCAYDAIERIGFEGGYCRSDIGLGIGLPGEDL